MHKKILPIGKRVLAALLLAAALLAVVFLAGRYGWRLGGFHACQSAGIETVEVADGQVKLTGFYPGSFPEGFIGYYAEEHNGKLYVGFRFSAVFGFFETGDFAITIPTTGEINEVVIKTRLSESSIWTADKGLLNGENLYGIYVKLQPTDIYSVGISYDGESGGLSAADANPLESGEYLFMDCDIMYAAKNAETPVSFTLTVAKADGSVFASGDFVFDANAEKMYLTVTSDGQITEDTPSRIPSPTETPTTAQAYATVIGEYYTALAEGWDAAALMDAGLNDMAADCGGNDPLENLGYAMTDLDGDGTKELLIGTRTKQEFYSKMIFSLYTLDDEGAPLLVFDGTERNRYYYAGDNRFANLGSSGANESFVTTLKLQNGEMIDMTYTTDPADYVQPELTPFSEWVN